VYFAVRQIRGGPWDFAHDLREQDGFEAHARFMDGLVDDGVVVLGGPLQGDRDVLLAVRANSEVEVRERFAADPWIQDGHLSLGSIESWTILLDGR
jgi:uncharacterized protein YciI